MGAEEEQGEGVVLVRGGLVAGSGREELVGRHLCGRALFAAPACPIAAQLIRYPARRDGDQPGPRVLGEGLLAPLDGGGEERFLHRVLARVEPAIPADEHAEDLRREPAQQVFDVGLPRQRSEAVMCMIGRTSTAKYRAEGSPVTISVALSILSHSSR